MEFRTGRRSPAWRAERSCRGAIAASRGARLRRGELHDGARDTRVTRLPLPALRQLSNGVKKSTQPASQRMRTTHRESVEPNVQGTSRNRQSTTRGRVLRGAFGTHDRDNLWLARVLTACSTRRHGRLVSPARSGPAPSGAGDPPSGWVGMTSKRRTAARRAEHAFIRGARGVSDLFASSRDTCPSATRKRVACDPSSMASAMKAFKETRKGDHEEDDHFGGTPGSATPDSGRAVEHVSRRLRARGAHDSQHGSDRVHRQDPQENVRASPVPPHGGRRGGSRALRMTLAGRVSRLSMSVAA